MSPRWVVTDESRGVAPAEQIAELESLGESLADLPLGKGAGLTSASPL